MTRPHLAVGLLLLLLLLAARPTARPVHAQANQTPTPMPASTPASASTPTPTPVFNFPVVADAEISGFFDHDPAYRSIRFFDGRTSTGANGFTFSCPAVGGAWVGCAHDATSETACTDESELWYDNHHGIDFEYNPDWRTGDSCDLAKFELTLPLIYAPAPGIVDYVGENDLYNGNFIRIYHDLNGDGNYYNDNLRSYYLHFADNGILVDDGEILAVGDALGYGGATGLAWTPHLHFEVQQRTNLGWMAVDPFGWDVDAVDPWYTPSLPLWDTSPQE